MPVQLAINGIIASATICLVACGFALFFQIHRFFHFAHAMVITLGAYGTVAATEWLHLPLAPSVAFGILTACLAGGIMDLFCYRILRKRQAGPMGLLLASLGLYIMLQNITALVFGNDPRMLFTGSFGTLSFSGVSITYVQIGSVLAAGFLLAGTSAIIRFTKLGLAMRAVSGDYALAYVSGLDVEAVLLGTTVMASALGGAAGIIIMMETAVSPSGGMKPFFLGVIASVIGGWSFRRTILASVLLGMALHLGVWKISSHWQDGIAFTILLVFLFSKPGGLYCRKD